MFGAASRLGEVSGFLLEATLGLGALLGASYGVLEATFEACLMVLGPFELLMEAPGTFGRLLKCILMALDT